MRPSVKELLCMPYVSQYVHKYAEHIMQLPDDIGHARHPSLNLDQLPIVKQIHRSFQHAVQGTDAPPPIPAPSTHSPIQPSSGAATGNQTLNAVQHQNNGEPDSEALSPAVDDSSPPVLASSPGRHNVGPESTWAVRQSAELEDLQGALDRHCFKRGRPAADLPAASAVETALAAEGDSMSPQDLQDPAEPKIALAPISKVTLSVAVQHNRELEKQQAVIQQERERRKQHASQRALEAEQLHRAKSIVRRQSMERHRREVAEQDFEKASKAAAAEQARRNKEQVRVKEQQEVQQRLAAHRQGIKAVKTRVDRAALQSLGEAFAARLQSGTEASDQPVLFVEATPDPSPAAPIPHTGPPTSGRASHSPRPAVSPPAAAAVPNQAMPSPSSGLNPTPPPFEQGSNTPPPGMPLRDWIKQKKRNISAAGACATFPDVQVYCPCGSAMLDSNQLHAHGTGPRVESELPQQSSSHGAVRSAVPGSSQLQPETRQHQTGAEAVVAAPSCLADRRDPPLLGRHQAPGPGPVLGVLTDIEDVLEGELTLRGGLPESPLTEEDVEGPSAGRVEQLRLSLEQQLGPRKLLAAHRYLTKVQNAQDDDMSTQAALEQILGEQMHLARGINKLLLLENAVYQ
ncbi:hypothetical protein ABBQ32_005668 [Trebouxia sp. C0010 RCD-2024]